MKVFTHREFDGHYPVGTAAVIVAPTAKHAKALLEAELKERGLPQKLKVADFREVDLATPCTYVLCDGDY